MKEQALRQITRTGLASLLLPLALGSSAHGGVSLHGTVRTTSASPAPTTADAPATPIATATAALPQPAATAVATPATLNVHRFEAMAEALVNEGRVPGLAMAIIKDGRVLSLRGYGITDVDHPQPVDTHTVFRLASLSKSFAGTITGILVNDGVLRWDSRLVDYLPAFQMSQPGAARQVTVADILSHRTGLVAHTFDRAIESNASYHSLVLQMADAPMQCAPGQCYTYQNVAFSLIGDIVFASTGKFFSEAVAERIFKPLGMHDASYGLEGIEASARWAKPHIRGRGGWTSVIPQPTYYRVAPAAGVNASISDMAQWLLAHTGHRPDVLPAPLLATLHAPLVSTPREMRGSSWRSDRLDAASYALGWRDYDYAGHRVVFHGGAVQGYRGTMAIVPELDLGVVILWNSTSGLPGGLMPTILDDALGIDGGKWLDDETIDTFEDILFAERNTPQSGTTAVSAKASPP